MNPESDPLRGKAIGDERRSLLDASPSSVSRVTTLHQPPDHLEVKGLEFQVLDAEAPFTTASRSPPSTQRLRCFCLRGFWSPQACRASAAAPTAQPCLAG